MKDIATLDEEYPERTQWGWVGQRLREERLRLNLSQEALAELVGSGVRSIRRWERGESFPYPHSREQLCQLFHMDAHVLFALGRDKPESTLENPLVWMVPFRRNPLFTGRVSVLRRLHEMLSSQQTVALNQIPALSGLGGIGKTHIALEYVYRYASTYTAVLWINAETPEAVLASFFSLAGVLHLPEHQELDQKKVILAVTRWLEGQKDWLLIFDNVEDLVLLQSLLPSSRQGSILLTTRLQAVGTVAQQITVEPLTLEDGTAFLLHRAKLLQPGMLPTILAPTDVSAAQAIVETMDGLPLALD